MCCKFMWCKKTNVNGAGWEKRRIAGHEAKGRGGGKS